jgi:hypothetical protein
LSLPRDLILYEYMHHFSSDFCVPISLGLRVNRQGSIPTEAGLLSNLTSLKLSYNAFVGDGAKLGGCLA